MTELMLTNERFIAPVADMATALTAYQTMKDFVQSVLRKGVDYGEIPSTDKPTLLKPGAEKLLRFFGLSITLDTLEKIEDWEGDDHGFEPFFFYRYKASAKRNETIIAEGIGSCSSWEKKYRFRTAELVCPECGLPLRKSKKDDGYYCWTKTGGCGANFKANDPQIVNQPRGNVPNPYPVDLVNTVDKMAQKRAIIAATLLACNASEYFTQDIEDLDYLDGKFRVITEPQIDAEISEVEQQPAKETEPPRDIATPTVEKVYDFKKRPYDPETLREAIRTRANDPKTKPADDYNLNLLGRMLSEFYSGNEEKIAGAKTYLLGKPHLHDVDRKLVTATISWMKLAKDSGGALVIDPMSRKELSAVFDAYLTEVVGQGLLFEK